MPGLRENGNIAYELTATGIMYKEEQLRNMRRPMHIIHVHHLVARFHKSMLVDFLIRINGSKVHDEDCTAIMNSLTMRTVRRMSNNVVMGRT